MYTAKSRVVPGNQWSSRATSYGYAASSDSGTLPVEVQRVMTENHSGFRKADGKRDVGGPFESWKIELVIPGTPWTSNYNYVDTQFQKGWQNSTKTFLVASVEVGQLIQSVKNLNLSTDASVASFLSSRVPNGPLSSTMNAMGTKAIALVKPDNPTVDLATTLGELWSERKFFSLPNRDSDLPGEFLNYQFGIAPTVGMFQDLRDAIERRDAILRQYIRDSEKVIRRSFHFPDEVTRTVTTSNDRVYAMGAGLTIAQNPSGKLTKVSTTTQKFWFDGAFRYAIPKDAFPRRLKELDRLYGVVPGVSTLWELLPFSWLVDYFTPIGNLLNNIDSFLLNGLVMPYAYIMSTTEVEDVYTWQGRIYDVSGHLVDVQVISIIKKTRLRRLPASPFGFGLLATDLSPKQIAILAALGMSLRK